MTAESASNAHFAESLDKSSTFYVAVDITATALDLTPEGAEAFLRNSADGLDVSVDDIAAELVRPVVAAIRTS